MKAYINGIGVLSPQKSYCQGGFLSDPVEYNSGYLKCIEPDIKEYLSSGQARRMSRIIKLSLVAAKICLEDANVEMPDAIINSTGLGCIDDTEKVLKAIIENKERFLSPTSFIHSTHNTISSQIAIHLKCHNYNLTFSHRNFSFESALLNSILFLAENPASNILLGAVDEITPTLFNLGRNSIYRDITSSNLNMLDEVSRGSYAGEGMNFFMISDNRTDKSYAKIGSVDTIYNISDRNEIQNRIESNLNRNGLKLNDIDAVMLGIDGDIKSGEIYNNISEDLFKEKIQLYYKHLCGEYFTSTAFAAWCCINILKEQTIPVIFKLNSTPDKEINNILIYNQFKNKNHSTILIQKC